MSADDLARFIADRLDEHEQGARAVEVTWPDAPYDDLYAYGIAFITDDCTTPTLKAVQKHAARHEPAHVLAFVAAGRAILELHAPCHECWPGHPYCHTCADAPLYTESWKDWPCPTVRTFGAIWAGHPAWREEWRA